MNYDEFIERKAKRVEPSGFDLDKNSLNHHLMPFQRDITYWALRVGKCAIFADCGLGKTLMELEWANHVSKYTGRAVLIFAPLSVSYQTVREGQKFGIDVNIATSDEDIINGINVTNYEKIDKFTPDNLSGIVLDESSILKNFNGIRKAELIDFAQSIPYRLAASATPSPNDLLEIGNHSEFLGVITAKELTALYFTQDGNSSKEFRLKRHAVAEFWKWLASWCVALRKPSDLGYDDEGFILPPLNKQRVVIDMASQEYWEKLQAKMTQESQFVDPLLRNIGNPGDTLYLFPMEAKGLEEQRRVRNGSIIPRVAEAAYLANNSTESWCIWCDLNAESAAIAKAIPDAVEVKGSDSLEHREDAIIGFIEGRYRVLVTKSRIAGFGMNFQHCHNVIFVGIGNSYEQFYQMIRRFYRFGQQHPVNVHLITTNMDGNIIENIEAKERTAMEMYDQIIHHMNPEINFDRISRQDMKYEEETTSGSNWTMHLGDCVQSIDKIESDSIHLSVYSPPFPGMYVYSNSPLDIGNVKDMEEMIEHFRYLMGRDKMYRIMMPGRNVFIHITQGVAQKGRDGYIGLKDFRGKIIAMMDDIGWIHYGEITIDKDPQLKAQRTKDHGLMFKSLANDAAKMHVAIPDMLLQFKKPGDNPVPIRAGISSKYRNEDGWVSQNEWINWARPVWYSADYQPGTWRPDYTGDSCPDGIKETDVLNVRQAKETNDERHLCPLQIGVIDRVVKVWSNPGETVFSPFAGIGSEGHSAIRLQRKFIGIELKRSYYENAIRNLRNAELEYGMDLFAYNRRDLIND